MFEIVACIWEMEEQELNAEWATFQQVGLAGL